MVEKENSNRKLPNPETRNYGDEREEKGYAAGYARSSLDTRKCKFFKEKIIRRLSDNYLDWLDDEIAKKAKR